MKRFRKAILDTKISSSITENENKSILNKNFSRQELNEIIINFLILSIVLTLTFSFPLTALAVATKVKKKKITYEDLSDLAKLESFNNSQKIPNALNFSITEYSFKKSLDFVFDLISKTTFSTFSNSKDLEKQNLLQFQLKSMKLGYEHELYIKIIYSLLLFSIIMRIDLSNVKKIPGVFKNISFLPINKITQLPKYLFEKISNKLSNRKKRIRIDNFLKDLDNHFHSTPACYFFFLLLLIHYSTEAKPKINLTEENNNTEETQNIQNLKNLITQTSINQNSENETTEEAKFFHSLFKFITHYFSYLLKHAYLIVFLVFVLLNRKVIYQILTSPTERKQLLKLLKKYCKKSYRFLKNPYKSMKRMIKNYLYWDEVKLNLEYLLKLDSEGFPLEERDLAKRIINLDTENEVIDLDTKHVDTKNEVIDVDTNSTDDKKISIFNKVKQPHQYIKDKINNFGLKHKKTNALSKESESNFEKLRKIKEEENKKNNNK
jgi:hypothetical protein